MEKELAEAKSKLKPTMTKEPVGLKGGDLTEEEKLKMYQTYFDVGAQNWYPVFEDLTYPTIFLNLSREEAMTLMNENKLYREKQNQYKFLPHGTKLESVLNSITESLQKAKWNQAFVKLSTRSPKDSMHILLRGQKSLEAKLFSVNKSEEAKNEFISKDWNHKLGVICQCIQDNFFIENGEQALEVLISSDRVFEDLEFAFSNEPQIPYEKCGLQIVLREWLQAIPITHEYRGFVWGGSLNAIGQYYHSIFFPELLEKKDEIKGILNKFFMEKVKPRLNHDSLKSCIVDMALINKDLVKLIEVNPFDGKCLASLKGSTGLFDLDDKNDLKTVMEGPLELRIRDKAMSDTELKMKLNVTWKEAMKGFL